MKPRPTPRKKEPVAGSQAQVSSNIKNIEEMKAEIAVAEAANAKKEKKVCAARKLRLPEIYYDEASSRYWVRAADDEFIRRNESNVRAQLKQAGLCDERRGDDKL